MKKEAPDYRSQVAKKSKELKGIARKTATVEPQKPESNARQLFNPGRFTGEGCGLFPIGKLPKGDAPDWTKDVEKYDFLK